MPGSPLLLCTLDISARYINEDHCAPASGVCQTLPRRAYNDRAMSAVDYRMAKRAVLRDLRKGFVSRVEVCDAHPELVRAARFIGEATKDDCPVCDEPSLKVVFYTYGSELKRENGRVRRKKELDELRARYGEFACYVVEVCTECSWNHLVRSYLAGTKHAG